MESIYIKELFKLAKKDNKKNEIPVSALLIKNNKFINCNRCPWGRSVIDIDPEIRELADECYHKNVEICENEFYTFTVTGEDFCNGNEVFLEEMDVWNVIY